MLPSAKIFFIIPNTPVKCYGANINLTVYKLRLKCYYEN